MGLLPFKKFGLAPFLLIELSNSLICSTPVEINLDNTDLRFVLFDLGGIEIILIEIQREFVAALSGNRHIFVQPSRTLNADVRRAIYQVSGYQ